MSETTRNSYVLLRRLKLYIQQDVFNVFLGNNLLEVPVHFNALNVVTEISVQQQDLCVKIVKKECTPKTIKRHVLDAQPVSGATLEC